VKRLFVQAADPRALKTGEQSLCVVASNDGESFICVPNPRRAIAGFRSVAATPVEIIHPGIIWRFCPYLVGNIVPGNIASGPITPASSLVALSSWQDRIGNITLGHIPRALSWPWYYGKSFMKARELMSSPVISVPLEASVREVASILLKHAIRAVPVVDMGGSLVGMISDSDLVARDSAKRHERVAWWLELMAGQVEPGVVAEAASRSVRDVMTAPVITVGEDSTVADVAQLMRNYDLKCMPVLREERLCGIITSGDLQRVVAQQASDGEPAAPKGFLESVFSALDHGFISHDSVSEEAAAEAAAPVPEPASAVSEEVGFDAVGFRKLVSNFERHESEGRELAQQAASEQRRARIAELVSHHVSADRWESLIQHARAAAENGEKEFLLLRFPSELCSDGGRSINVSEADWPASLRGEAAEMYLRWERELKPRGFHLAASILDFPDGMLGDVGLFLVWA